MGHGRLSQRGKFNRNQELNMTSFNQGGQVNVIFLSKPIRLS